MMPETPGYLVHQFSNPNVFGPFSISQGIAPKICFFKSAMFPSSTPQASYYNASEARLKCVHDLFESWPFGDVLGSFAPSNQADVKGKGNTGHELDQSTTSECVKCV